MPPIRGYLQTSMALKDKLFQNMTVEEFHSAVKPKVDGSWNLHTLLPKYLDFFVLLSSNARIIGNAGQSNYCCGNTYQDALARYRVSQGEKVASLDLGVLESIGYVSEREYLAEHLRYSGYEGLHEGELHAILEYYCDLELPVQPLIRSQLITKLQLPASISTKGLSQSRWQSKPLFRYLHQINVGGAVSQDSEAVVDYNALLGASETIADAGDIICDAMRTKLSNVLAIKIKDMDPDKAVLDCGVDSLVALEIRNWFVKAVNADVAIFEILSNDSMATLALTAARKSKFVHSSLKADDLQQA